MQTDVAVVPEVGDALPAHAIRAQVNLIQEVMKEVMIKDTHFGIIPGTPKPSLYKPGAEKLCLTFRLDPQYESVDRFLGEHLFVKSKCTLYHSTTGRRLGSGEGSCSTKESKYAYRKGQRLCPKCGKESIIKGKAEYGGGWLCFDKKGGCKAKWPDGAKEIEDQNTDRVPNEDLADQYNTVLKMANKRSLIAAVLNVTGASDIFTQDIEDLPPPPPTHDVKQEEKKPLRTPSQILAESEAKAAVASSVLEPQTSEMLAEIQQSVQASHAQLPLSLLPEYLEQISLSQSVAECSKTLNTALKDETLTVFEVTSLNEAGKQKILALRAKK